ncbi:hypothetical protein ZWY2020_048774 [Hordeum vulgare]|nr:hypothetical protein ZWY2020_048774 [Hordeum vulgare]
MAFDGCCTDCNHAIYLHYILKWVNSQTSTPLCPMCCREWCWGTWYGKKIPTHTQYLSW